MKDKKEGQKGWRDEEEGVSVHWMILRKGEDPGILKRKHQITLCGELGLDEAMDMSQDRLRDVWV
jgi:hypothetical protein